MIRITSRWLWISAISILLLTTPVQVAHAQDQEPPPPIVLWSAQGPVVVERDMDLATIGQAPEQLLAVLLDGPTAEERDQGLWSAIPAGTTLAALQQQPDGVVIVRLDVPHQALRGLNHETFEIIARQIGATLDPLSWRELRIETWDPIADAFVPLADYLPEIPPPRKETVTSGEEGPSPAPQHIGQPPAPGQGQPQGGLSGKTIYVSAGHGWLWNDSLDTWRTQRPPYPNPLYYDDPIIEDHNNAEAVNQYFLQYLWNAGAMVWPTRERDMNTADVIVDNDAPGPNGGYSETGSWATTALTGTGYAGTDYRYTHTVSDTPTATAVWTATLPADGRYAVYVWYRPGTNRASDAHYTVRHAGGETKVIVDQQHHGITWHYIGTYGFRAAEEARITLSNQSTVTESVVIADAVRFGGGNFDNLSGIETAATYPPDKPWWEVAAFYYTQRMGMGQPYGDVTARPVYARWEHAGTGDDAVYVSWHTNGVSGYQWDSRGTVSIIHNGEGEPITPGSAALRDAIHNEMVQDFRAGWDSTWPGAKRSMNLGELRELWDDDPATALPGALIEVAYHDHPDDTDALKEPTFQMLAARAMYQGIVKYFEQRDSIDLTLLPEPPTHLAVQNVGGGQVRVSWRPSPTDTLDLGGDAATGYRVYTSTDGIGWSDGTPVTGATSYTLSNLSQGQRLFVRVTATNDGGESFPTETLVARAGSEADVLLINGFDRLNRTMTVQDYDPVEGYNRRVLLDQMNRYDYVIQHAEAITRPFDSTSNEALQAGSVNLSDYTLADWILGEESSQDKTLNETEQALLEAFLDSGGALFISGAEIGWDLDHLGSESDRAFYNHYLRADYAGDDAESYDIAPVAGSIFDGLPLFRFDAPGMYDADYPDQLLPLNGSQAALTYHTGLGGTAAIQYEDGCERLVYLGFPFEVIHPEHRPAVMARALDFLSACLGPTINTRITSPKDGSAHNSPPPFAGTAGIDEAATLDRIEVQIQRESDGLYWSGSDWATGTSLLPGTAWLTGTAWIPPTGFIMWTYPLADVALTDDSYALRARAWTTEGISDTSPAEVRFTYDTISPTAATLITPTGGITTGSTVEFMWEPIAPDGGSSLAYRVKLDERLYTTTESVYTITHVDDGPHVWGVQVFDAAGNRSTWVTDTFNVKQYTCWLPLILRALDESPSGCSDAIVNGGFESDAGWTLSRAIYTGADAHSGARSAQIGLLPGEPGPGELQYSSVRQQVTVPSGSSATLRLWLYPISEGGDPDDLHYVTIFDQDDYRVLDTTTTNDQTWIEREYDVSDYLGQTLTLYIGAKNDGNDDTVAMFVDDVALDVCP